MASGAIAMGLDGTNERGLWRVILASAVGTMIEWYDFYIFGSLAAVLSPKFFPPGNDTFAYISYLATFAVGFMVRPFGALFFGRIGDIVGRKYAFLVTLSIMGGATALIGFLPTYASIGLLAPIILLTIRVLQGLALGGEYGGATVYVAEHVRTEARLLYELHPNHGDTRPFRIVAGHSRHATSHDARRIQSVGLAHSLPRIDHSCNDFSLHPLRMKESPIFSQIKASGMTSAQPLKEAFTKPENLKRV